MTIVKRVGVLSLGKVLGLLYALLGLIFGGLVSLISLAGFAGSRRGPGGAEALLLGAGAFIILPLLYGAIGFVGGIIVAAIYNLIASIGGGLELELESPAPPAAFPVTSTPWSGA